MNDNDSEDVLMMEMKIMTLDSGVLMMEMKMMTVELY